MNKMNEYLLPEHERPSWLTYPAELADLVSAGRVKLTPWHICKIDAVRWDLIHLKNRLGRDLVPFAHRQDREDLACFEKGRGQEILIIHDNTDPGWENEGSYPSFHDWLQAVETESELWR
jgi:hypothetical protein